MSSDFLSVGVSGMDDTVLLSGMWYGGCVLLCRKLLSSSIIPLCTSSNRLCAVRWQELSGSSVLLVCVYLPSESAMSCYSDYLNTLGELEGFRESQRYINSCTQQHSQSTYITVAKYRENACS